MPENSIAPESGADMLARVQPVRRTKSTQICLRPDLLDAWEQANETLDEMTSADNAGARLGAGVSTATRKQAQVVADLEAEIEATQARFLFTSMNPDEWNALAANHPPRPDNPVDAFYGSDRDAVLDAAVRECMTSPKFDDCTKRDCEHTDCGSWQQFRLICNPSEWSELRNVVNEANSGVNDSPKSELASRILSSSASASKRPKPGA